MKNQIFNILIGILLTSISFGKNISMSIDSMKVLRTNNSLCISWDCSKCLNTLRYNIYLIEGKSDVFPNMKIDTLNEKATVWCFKKRESIDILGMNIKDFKQWDDKSVLTQGEVYTVGIEREFLDVKTQKPATERNIFVIYPFQIVNFINVVNLDSIEQKAFFEFMPSSYHSFIKLVFRKNLLFLYQNTQIPIINIYESKDNYILKLANSKFVNLYKTPDRPEPFGNPSQIKYTILIILMSSFILILLITVFTVVKSIHYLNYILEDSNNVKSTFNTIINNEKMFFFIIYMICIIIRFDILKKLIHHFFGLDFIIFEFNEDLMKITEDIMVIFSKYNLSEISEIKIELLNLNS